GWPGHRRLLADAHADVRPADHELRDLLQSGRGGRIDQLLGRIGGHRTERSGPLQRSAVRRGTVPDGDRARRPPTRADRAAAAALFELPPELSIDTDVARRVITEFIRGQLRQAGFERAVLGLSGGIDSALVAYLVTEAIGPDRLLCVLMPYATSSPASRSDA